MNINITGINANIVTVYYNYLLMPNYFKLVYLHQVTHFSVLLKVFCINWHLKHYLSLMRHITGILSNDNEAKSYI